MADKIIDNDFYEEWLAFIICLNEVLGKNENLWDKYQKRKSKKRTEYLKNILQTNSTESILKPETILYRARIIGVATKEKTILFQEESAIYTDFEKYFVAKMGKSAFNTFNDAQNLIMLNSGSTDEEYISLINRIKGIVQKQFQGFPAEKCSCPPKKLIKEGRLNCKEDEYLYLSTTIKTCINEMRPANNHMYSVASAKSKKKLTLCDLTYNALSKNINNEKTQDVSFVARKVSEPNSLDDKKFYSITQELAHIIENRGYDGIKFDSAMCEGGVNILLFDKNAVEFISSKIVNINNINVKFGEAYREEPESENHYTFS